MIDGVARPDAAAEPPHERPELALLGPAVLDLLRVVLLQEQLAVAHQARVLRELGGEPRRARPLHRKDEEAPPAGPAQRPDALVREARRERGPPGLGGERLPERARERGKTLRIRAVPLSAGFYFALPGAGEPRRHLDAQPGAREVVERRVGRVAAADGRVVVVPGAVGAREARHVERRRPSR